MLITFCLLSSVLTGPRVVQKVLKIIHRITHISGGVTVRDSKLYHGIHFRKIHRNMNYILNIPILPMAFLTFAEAKVGSAPPFV